MFPLGNKLESFLWPKRSHVGLCFTLRTCWIIIICLKILLGPREDLEEYLTDSIDILLGPPAATGRKKGIDESLAGLPPQVASVYQFVFEEEADVASTRGQLSNPVAIDSVLDQLEGNKKLLSSERSKLKTDVEEAIRKMVSKFLADRDN